MALSGILATGLIRSRVDDWAYVDPYPEFEVYSSWALVVGFGAGLVYLLVWVAFPSLPPYDYEGGLSILPVGSRPSLLADPCRTGASAEAATGSIHATAVLPFGDSERVRVKPVGTRLLHVLDGSVRSGAFLTEVTEREPVLVLGTTAAGWLGVGEVGSQLRVGEHWFRVEGILDPLGSLHAKVDESALVGFSAAEALLGFHARPDTLYVGGPSWLWRRAASIGFGVGCASEWRAR